MTHKFYILLSLMAAFILSACSSGHEDLKAPCTPFSAFIGSPCEFSPINVTTF